MGEFKDRVSGIGKEGYRNLEVIDAETSGLTNGTTFKAKVQFDDDATENGTPYAKSNIATANDNKNMAQGDKVVTADNIASEFTKRKRLNLFPDGWTENTDGWTNTTSTDVVNSDNQQSGEGCLEVTLSSTTGSINRDILDYLDNTKYYLISAYVKNSDLSSSGARIKVTFTGGGTTQLSSYSTSTSWTRVGVIVSPSELSGATACDLFFDGSGVSTEKFFGDSVSVVEISAYEYSLGVATLLTQLPWTDSRGIETYDNVTTLPSEDNMSNGRCDVVVDGQSLENGASNGDFSNGTTDWVPIGATLSESGRILSVTGSGTTVNPSSVTTSGSRFKTNDSDIIFIYSRQRVTNSVSTSLELAVVGTTVHSITQASPTQNVWYELYGKLTITTGATASYIRNRHVYADTATANGKVMEVDGNAGVFAINMTTLGIEHLSESQMLELVRAGYFESLQGTEGVEVDSKGKNLFNYTSADNSDVYLNSSGVKSASTDWFVSDYIEVDENETYVLNYLTGSVDAYFIYYDGSLNIISNETNTSVATNNNIPTLPTGTRFFRYSSKTTTAPIEEYQLELGSSATAYEPYKNSKASMPVGLALYSVPNGVRSSFNFNTGVEDKRVDIHTLTGSSDVIALDTTNTNIDLVRVEQDNFIGLISQTSGVTPSVLNIPNFKACPDYTLGTVDDTANEYTYVYSSSFLSDIWLVVPKSTYANLAAAQSDLDGQEWHYELATYEQIQHQPQELQAFTNGTLFKNQQQTETLTYNSGLTLLSGLTPTSCVKMVKLDLDNDTETDIDISDVTVGSPTTISGASDGEVYRYTYRHTGATTGRLHYMYNLNTKDQVDGNSDGLRDIQRQINYINDKLDNTSDWVTLSDYTVEGSGDSQIDIDLSAVNYTHCRLLISNAISSTATTRNLNMQFNTDTGSNYNHASYNLNGTSAVSGTGTTSISLGNNLLTTNTTPSSGGFAEVLIFNTDSGDRKSVKIDCMYSGGTTSGIRTTGAGTWTNTADNIDSIELKPTADSIGVGSRIIVEVRRIK